jgi:hypothetical protein
MIWRLSRSVSHAVLYQEEWKTGGVDEVSQGLIGAVCLFKRKIDLPLPLLTLNIYSRVLTCNRRVRSTATTFPETDSGQMQISAAVLEIARRLPAGDDESDFRVVVILGYSSQLVYPIP